VLSAEEEILEVDDDEVDPDEENEGDDKGNSSSLL